VSYNRGFLNFLSDESSSFLKDAFLSRLMETGATESSSSNNCPDQMEVDIETAFEKNKNVVHNIVDTINGLWHLKDGLHAAVLKQLPEDGKSILALVYVLYFSWAISFRILSLPMHFLLC